MDVTVNECTVLHQECRVVGDWDFVIEVMYATESVVHVGLPAVCNKAWMQREYNLVLYFY